MPIFTSMLDEALEAWQGVREGLIEEVKNISADRFDFRLTPETRSVTELVQHVMEVACMMTGELCREDTNFRRAPWPKLLEMHASHVHRASGKTDLLKLLRSSLAEGRRRFEKAGEIHMLQLITRFDGKQGTRLAWLHHGIGHEMYHTGQLTAYARALGKTPALTQWIGSSSDDS